MKTLIILLTLSFNCLASEKQCLAKPTNLEMAQCLEREQVNPDNVLLKNAVRGCLLKNSNEGVYECYRLLRINKETLKWANK